MRTRSSGYLLAAVWLCCSIGCEPLKRPAGSGGAGQTPGAQPATPGMQPATPGVQPASPGAQPTTPPAAGASATRFPLRLKTPVALPVTTVEGTIMTFSVDYRFVEGAPDPAASYLFVIQPTQGTPAEVPAQLTN